MWHLDTAVFPRSLFVLSTCVPCCAHVHMRGCEHMRVHLLHVVQCGAARRGAVCVARLTMTMTMTMTMIVTVTVTATVILSDVPSRADRQ